MDKYEIRRINLLKLKDEQCHGVISELADRINKNPSYVSRLLYPVGKPNKKNIADKVTTDIEESFNLPRGWLDGFYSTTTDTKKSNINPLEKIEVDEWDSNTPLGDDEVEVPYFSSIELAAGHGCSTNDDYNNHKLRFGKSFFRRKGAQKENVICFPVRGDSMTPILPNGATVAVDTGKKEIVDGDIYAISQGDLYRVKRLYRMPNNKLRINSLNSIDNPDEFDEAVNVQVIGRVFHYSAEL